jgi:hypothetical protein
MQPVASGGVSDVTDARYRRRWVMCHCRPMTAGCDRRQTAWAKARDNWGKGHSWEDDDFGCGQIPKTPNFPLLRRR